MLSTDSIFDRVNLSQFLRYRTTFRYLNRNDLWPFVSTTAITTHDQDQCPRGCGIESKTRNNITLRYITVNTAVRQRIFI